MTNTREERVGLAAHVEAGNGEVDNRPIFLGEKSLLLESRHGEHQILRQTVLEQREETSTVPWRIMHGGSVVLAQK